MESERKDNRQPSGRFFFLKLVAGFAIVVCITLMVYRPDRPVDTIVPGSSSEPAFVVQVIRPRAGLPLGGLVPPQVFGLEATLGFESTTLGATIGIVGPNRIELGADKWELVIVQDVEGRVAPETHVVFEFLFEDQLRRVRCWPGDPAVGTFNTTKLPKSGSISGNFDIELSRCVDAKTGEPLGWPPQPLVLHGSFDRLPINAHAKKQVANPSE